MTERPGNDGPRRLATRPFAGSRAGVMTAPSSTASPSPAIRHQASKDLALRPLPFTGLRTSTGSAMITRVAPPASPEEMRAPTPLWTVAVYEPGLEHVTPREKEFDRPRQAPAAPDDLVDASLALAEDIVEAGRLAAGMTAADVLEVLAGRLRRGEILLLPGASTKSDVAIVSAVLTALLGARR